MRPARTYISWVALALMTTSSVASLRPSPTMALYGLAAVFLYLVPAVVFLSPTALVSAELASGWDGGVYNWVARGRLGWHAIARPRVAWSPVAGASWKGKLPRR